MASLALVVAALLALCGANHVPDYGGVGPGWSHWRSRTVSSRAPISRALNGNMGARHAVLELLKHFEAIGGEMKRRRHETYARTALRVVCNVADKRVGWYHVSIRLHNFGLRWFRSTCITDVNLGDANSLLGSVNAFQAALKRKRNQIIMQARVGWRDAFLFSQFKYDAFAQTCTLHHVPALRVQSKWALFTALTKYKPANNTLNRERPYLEELITTTNNLTLTNVPITIKNRHYRNVTSTTVVSNWGGIPEPTVFGVIPGYHWKKLSDNPAIAAALHSSSQWREQVEASFNAANIAIMAFSCVIALVPLSAFCQAKLHVIFIYVLLTDVFACAPLAIKGIELMHFSERLHQAVRTRVYGLDYELDLGVAEMWVASCSAPIEVYWTGVKFVATAFSFMVVGVVAELFMLFRQQMSKRRMREKLLAEKRLDRWWDPFSTTCSVCFCTHTLKHEGTRNLYAAKKFLFRIPSARLPSYRPDEGWAAR